MEEKKIIQWKSPGKNEVDIELSLIEDTIDQIRVRGVGNLQFLNYCNEFQEKLKGSSLAEMTPPLETTPQALIWGELILKIKGQWNLPVEHEELCHCRKVSTKKVDDAIVYGAHNLRQIRKRTSANTGCGTCLKDIESLLTNRKI